MAILCPVESKSKSGRLFHGVILLVLLIGGVTMVYPFLLMLAGSMRSPLDEAEIGLLPGYLVNEQILTRKFYETKYNQVVSRMNRAHHRRDYSIRQATVPDHVVEQRAEDLRAFWRQSDIPRHWQVLGGTYSQNKVVTENLRVLRGRLQAEYEDDLQALSRDLGSPLSSWLAVQMRPPKWLSPRYGFNDTPITRTYLELMHDSPLAERWLMPLTGQFLEMVLYPSYGRATVAAYNHAHVRDLESYVRFRLPRRIPSRDQPTLRKEWLSYVQDTLNASFIRVTGVRDEAWRGFLRERYDSIDGLNRIWGTEFEGFGQIRLPDKRAWLGGGVRQDFRGFLRRQDPESLVLVGPEFAWADWLQRKYGSLEALNQAHQASYASFVDAAIPTAELEKDYVHAHATGLRWDYATRNYINVFNEMLFQGRPFFNTLVFVFLAVVFSLLINPLAAYAMSRFELPGTYKILMILMATVAFPPMVAMIPQFLMLREVGLLNTFVALVLPVVVNGYLVFLLKGFFDSLPQDLYDAARIDGASEFRMFFQITMALSKPILAVVALMAFNHAYLMFLYALIVAPKQEMWLISVWLFQYQTQATTAAVYTSVLVASIPTFLIFLFTQRTIMRGIVVPTEK